MDLNSELTTTPAKNERAIIAKQIGNLLKPFVTMGMAYFGQHRGGLVLSYNQILGISAAEDLDDALLDYELDNNPKKLAHIISRLIKGPERYRSKLAEFAQQTKQYVEEQIRVTMVYEDTPERSKLLEEIRLKGPQLIAERENDIATFEQALEKLQQLIPQGLTAATISRAATPAPEQRAGLPGNIVATNLSLQRR